VREGQRDDHAVAAHAAPALGEIHEVALDLRAPRVVEKCAEFGIRGETGIFSAVCSKAPTSSVEKRS
jgi:hypothetical protein